MLETAAFIFYQNGLKVVSDFSVKFWLERKEQIPYWKGRRICIWDNFFNFIIYSFFQ